MIARIKSMKTLASYITIFFISILSIYLICFVFTKVSSSVPNQVKSLKDYTGNWEMRLGDSPFDKSGTPVWTNEKTSNGDWTKIDYSAIPTSTHTTKVVWFRTKIQNPAIAKLYVLFMSSDYDSEVYLDNQEIYKHGDFNVSQGKFKFGTTWNYFPIPPDCAGKMLYFRTYAPLPISIGHSIDGVVGTEVNILEEKATRRLSLFKDEMDYLVLAFLFIFIGLVTILIYFMRNRKQPEFFSLGFSSVFIGIWLITDRKIILSYFDCQVILNDLAVISIQLMPIGIISFIGIIFGGRQKLILKRIWQYFVVYNIVTFILNLTHIYPYFYSLKFFHISLVLSMIVIIYTVILSAKNGNKEAGIICVGIAVLSFTGINDILIISYNFRIFPSLSDHHITHLGMFAFVLTLVYVLGLRFVKVHNQLVSYSIEIEEKNKTLNQMWEEVKQSRDAIAEWNKVLERTVVARTASIKNLLNNAGQGFLSFGLDLLVNEEYSSECLNIFGERIENKSFPDLLFPDNEEQRTFLETILFKVLYSPNDSRREIYLPLIPDEVTIGGKHINVNYKIIKVEDESSEGIMAVLTDITEKRVLETQMEHEKNVLKMVVKVVVNYTDFCECVKDYQNFFKNKMHQILKSKNELEIVFFEIFRNIHTFKGTFSQFDMFNTVHYLHELESQLANMRLDIKSLTLDYFKSFISNLNMFDSLIDDIEILRNILGEQFFKQNNVFTVEKSRLLEIEKKALSILSPFECKIMLPDLKRLMYKPFNQLLKIYPEYVMKTSERLEKFINPLVIEGGETPVDSETYYEFSKSLIHIFKNMMDHGIESADERYEAGKDEFGNIKCKIEFLENNISIIISDDGRGMDLEKIKLKAVEKGLYDDEGILKLSEEQLINLTFTDEFSTKEDVTELSGRGIGLSAVNEEVKKLGGRIEVKSLEGQGTEFRFILPNDVLSDNFKTSIQDIMNPLIESTTDFINKHLGEAVLLNEHFNVKKEDFISLSKYSSIINIKGILEANFIITFDESLAKKIAGESLRDISAEEYEGNLLDSIAEYSNIILGNSIKMFRGVENMIMISSPLSVSSSEAFLKYQGLDVWTCNLKFKSGTLSLSFLTSEHFLGSLS